jgi:hypothetical protein
MLTLGILLGNIVLLSGLAVVGWRNRSEPGATIFALLESVSAVWTGLAVAGLRLPPGEARIRIWSAATGLSLVVVVLWMAFILRYTGRDRWLRLDRLGVASVPLLGGSLLYAFAPTWMPFVGRIEQSAIAPGTVVYSSIGPVGTVLAVYIYLFFLAGLLMVLKTIVETNTLYIGQALAFLLGTFVTIVASVGEIVGVPVGGYP